MNNKAKHFDELAGNDANVRQKQRGFHNLILKLFKYRISPGSDIVELGCGKGDLLTRLNPAKGLGIDISEKMIASARQRSANSNIEYSKQDASSPLAGLSFDHIVSDFLLGYLDDIQETLSASLKYASPRSRIHISSLNTIWQPILNLGQKLGWVSKQPPSNWLSSHDIKSLLEISGWEVISSSTEILFPFEIPIISSLFNKYLVRLPVVRHLGSTLMITARPRIALGKPWNYSCSVIVPMRNEAGNVTQALDRIPNLGSETEVIFIEGNSKDDTWETIQREVDNYNGPLKLKYAKQPGIGKWDAVSLGFEMANNDILVIQDGDLTAPPEDLPKFFNAICDGTCEFANGSRLIYPMESKAMRFLNMLGNKFFAIALSYVLGQPVKDSLCGTKMLLRKDYKKLLKRIEEFGDFDPFGDFNLLFGSALLNLKIRDIPVRYKDRLYGDTNISRFSHGLVLLRMTLFGLFKIKFNGYAPNSEFEKPNKKSL